ncbi:helix-turn-helix domain-containing protein [Actinosynnema sp. NPDC023658]|uniref:MarR family transcriptional regulator n=1 Tax=Actinosynnema sp. NPDC023658 TaxID=3155465 RepID=UPI0033EA20A5
MNGVALFLLGRTLMKIGEEAMPAPVDDGKPRSGSTRLVLIVLSDIVEHPDSSIGEIVERTGLPQSQVSTAVARLRETGSLDTRPDPADRRRVLVRQAEHLSDRVAQVRGSTVDDALAAALGTDDRRRVAEVSALLDALAAHLTPLAGRAARAASDGVDRGSAEPD